MLKWISAIFWYVLAGLIVLFWGFSLVLCVPFVGRKKSFLFIQSWSRMMVRMTQKLCRIELEVLGRENLKNPPAIFLSKHQSAWETFALFSVLPSSSIIFKKSLLFIPFLGFFLWLTGQIPINRSQGIKALKAVIEEGKKKLNNGVSILIFPEGTRVLPKAHPRFHKSALALAKASGYPIVPIAHNAGSLWPLNSILKHPGKVTVIIGEPYSTDGKSLNTIESDLHHWMSTTMNNLEK